MLRRTRKIMAHLSTTWKHVRRSPYQTFGAILIMMVTFFTISIFTFLIFGSSKIIQFFESKPQVTAFFTDSAKQEDIDNLEKQLRASGKVASMQFVSKQEALQIYKEQNKNDPLLLDLVTADILPSSLEISTIKLSDLSDVSSFLKSSPLVQEVVFQKDVVATLTIWTNALRKIGVVLIVGLAAISIFIMTTIIGIKISQKREEIEIMRLIGATKWYISFPFVLEGIFYGLVGAILGWALAAGGLWYATPFLSSFLRGISIFPVPWSSLLELLGAECLLAIFLGIFASRLAVVRYLK